MLHIDSKKLACIERTGHRVTGNPRDHVRGAGWEAAFVAIDDRSRVAFAEMFADDPQFESVWSSSSEMLVTYSDAEFVSEDYARELTLARTAVRDATVGPLSGTMAVSWGAISTSS